MVGQLRYHVGAGAMSRPRSGRPDEVHPLLRRSEGQAERSRLQRRRSPPQTRSHQSWRECRQAASQDDPSQEIAIARCKQAEPLQSYDRQQGIRA